jgi:hypothetical protein
MGGSSSVFVRVQETGLSRAGVVSLGIARRPHTTHKSGGERPYTNNRLFPTAANCISLLNPCPQGGLNTALLTNLYSSRSMNMNVPWLRAEHAQLRRRQARFGCITQDSVLGSRARREWPLFPSDVNGQWQNAERGSSPREVLDIAGAIRNWREFKNTLKPHAGAHRAKIF